MRVSYALDEGLPVYCETGSGLDTVRSLQSAIKFLVKTKEVMAATQDQIEVYPPGTTIKNFRERTPLKPDDKIPKGTSKEIPLFIHAERDYQDLNPEERRLYAEPPYNPDPPKQAPKKMARPPATQLKMNRPRSKSPTRKRSKSPVRKKGPTPEELAAKKKQEEEEEARKRAEEEARKRAEEEAKRQNEEEERLTREAARKKAEEEAARKKAEEEAAAKKKAGEEAAARRAAERPKFQGTPMDLSVQKCWYQLEGDIVPYYIRINGWEKGKELKEHILATRRSGRNAKLLENVKDPCTELKLIPPGETPESGQEIGTDDVLPPGQQEDPILVVVHNSTGQGRTLTPIHQSV